MPFRHTLQGSRFELKYVTDERRARAIRDFLRSYLQPDEHALYNPNHEYVVHSLYLDTPDFALCRATLHGERNRFKLRIRFYDDNPEGATYFEIKRRQDNVILKRRAAVRRRQIGRLLAGQPPLRSDLVEPSAEHFGTLQSFCGLSHTIRAQGRLFVSYMREAYVTPEDNSLRVTFDRRLGTCRYTGSLGVNNGQEWFHPRVGGGILEIKFTDRFPRWLADMVRVFDLERRSVAKYVMCVQELRRRGVQLGTIRRVDNLEASR